MFKQIATFIFLFFVVSFTAQAQQEPPKPVKTTRLLLVLDASGSMFAKIDGIYRMDLAKELLVKLVDSLKTIPNLQLGLRVYGHQFPSEQRNCQDSRLEVPFSANSAEQIKTRLPSIVPRGTTPISYSLLQSANDFPKDPNSRNVVVLITDGLESCNGDPCAVSQELQKKNVFLRPFIVGVGSDPEFVKQFSCMGEYFDANTASAFRSVLGKIVKQTLGKTTVTVELTDADGKTVESNINMTFKNSFTQQIMYDLVHWRNSAGVTDEVDVEPVMTYDLIVNTIPKVEKKNIVLRGGERNVIKVAAPQGSFKINLQAARYGGGKAVGVLVYDKKGTLIHHQTVDEETKLLEGNYRIEVLTTPRTVFDNVAIKRGQRTDLKIDDPGLISLLDRLNGYGSLYHIKPDGTQDLLFQFEQINRMIPVQPGRYKIVVRSQNALGNRFTQVREVNVISNDAVNLKIF
jgi:Ca-activated chloride channel family protein